MRIKEWQEAIDVAKIKTNVLLAKNFGLLAGQLFLFCVLFFLMILSCLLHVYGANTWDERLAGLACIMASALFIYYRKMIIIYIFSAFVALWDIIEVLLSVYNLHGYFLYLKPGDFLWPLTIQPVVILTALVMKFLLDYVAKRKTQ